MRDITPIEYVPYVAIDPLGNVIMSEVPNDMKNEVREWMQSDWGRETFPIIGGKNYNWRWGLEDLSKRVYAELTRRFGIPEIVGEMFVISREFDGRAKCRFDSFSQINVPVDPDAISRIDAQARNIYRWMMHCRERGEVLPIQDYLNSEA